MNNMKKMKNMTSFIIIVFFIVQSFIFADVVNTIVGVVGSLPITREDFISRKNFLALQARSVGQKVTDDEVYRDLIEERIMYLKLNEYEYAIEDRDVDRRMESIAKQYNMTLGEFGKQLRAEGISYDEYRTSMRKQIAMENLYSIVANAPEVTDTEADDFYKNTKNKAMFDVDTIVKLSWIFFKATTFTEKGEQETLAQRVRGLAARGRDFASLAKEYSDDAATKSNGGDLGYNLLSDAGSRSLPVQVNAGLNMVKNGSKVGAVSGVRELVGRGFYIVKIMEVQKDDGSIRTRVKSYLYERRLQEAFLKWMDEEVKRVSVTLYK